VDIGRPCRSCAVAEEVTIMRLYRWILDVKNWRETVFTGHFGPMGIGAIFISTLTNEFLHEHVGSHPTTTGSSYQQHQIEMVMDMVQPIVAFIVLCSITIHGLSILGFSLGKRVRSLSRTWSRRDTTGSGRAGAPDWTNQARLVTKGKGYRYNRDLEQGEGREVPLKESMTMMSLRTLNSSSNADEQKEDISKEDTIAEEAKPQVDPIPVPTPISATHQSAGQENQGHPDDHRNQSPPVRERRQTLEWIEGDQRVVEHQLGRFGNDVCFAFFFPFSRFD